MHKRRPAYQMQGTSLNDRIRVKIKVTRNRYHGPWHPGLSEYWHESPMHGDNPSLPVQSSHFDPVHLSWSFPELDGEPRKPSAVLMNTIRPTCSRAVGVMAHPMNWVFLGESGKVGKEERGKFEPHNGARRHLKKVDASSANPSIRQVVNRTTAQHVLAVRTLNFHFPFAKPHSPVRHPRADMNPLDHCIDGAGQSSKGCLSPWPSSTTPNGYGVTQMLEIVHGMDITHTHSTEVGIFVPEKLEARTRSGIYTIRRVGMR